MPRIQRRGFAAIAGIAIMAMAFTGCASTTDSPAEEPEDNGSQATEGGDYYPVTVTDMAGNEVVIESADSVVITDNRLFQLAADWGIELVAAPRSLMSENNPMKNDESILDTGSHREPDLEQIVNADPDLIINGQRYQGHADDVRAQAPDAAFVDTTNDELSTTDYIIQTVTLMGEIFDKQDEAAALVDDFNGAIEAAKEAYDPSTTVMGLITSGNEIRYSSAVDGRGASDYFDIIGITSALDEEGSTNHQGDDISLEAIAEAQADFFLVLDRDAAVSGGEEATPAMELITGSASLADVPAVQNNAIYVMPNDYYLTEDIFAHITVLQGLTEAFSAA